MTAIIYYNNGQYQDGIKIEGNTIEELREVAYEEINKRGWEKECCYSEVFEVLEIKRGIDMTAEEIIADERYHTCGRCRWENYPFICHRCKWGEDVRKDLWELKEDAKESEDEK